MNVEAKVKQYLDRIKKDNKRINAVLEVNENALNEARAIDKKKHKGRLAGYVIGVKSNINVIGLTASCASRTLENYKASYDASVIEKIKAEDGVIIGMLNCDEFAAGVSGENSAFGVTENPVVAGCVPGGSSSGSAAAVAAGFCDVALGSDTGGSIRVPASFCGLVGIKPSYGLVSRYGLIDLSMSLDQIGTFGKNVSDATLLLDVIRGKDERDTTTFVSNEIKLHDVGKIKVGVLRIDNTDKKVQSLVDKKIKDVCDAKGWKMEDVEVKYIDLAIETYHPIVWTEFFSATRRFDGRKYGKKIEDFSGPEVLRRIFGGSEISRAEFSGRNYHKALEVREMIRQEFERVFDKFDCVVSATVPVLAWKLGTKLSTEALYAVDALTIPANLAGICAVSVPCGKIDGKPVGLQIMCRRDREARMLSIAREFE